MLRRRLLNADKIIIDARTGDLNSRRLMNIMREQGFAANADYMYESEALKVTRFPSTTFYQKNVGTFDEFRYFKKLSTVDRYCFAYCTLSTITVPANGYIHFALEAFTRMPNITSAVFEGRVGFYHRTFAICSKLQSVTLKYDGVCDGEQNFFFNTPNAKLYVPAHLVDAYKADKNWSVYADRILPIP